MMETVVVQPTPFCNINCSYCYLPQRNVKTVMEQDTIASLFAKIFSSGWASHRLTVIWHAGETLSRADFILRERFRGNRGIATVYTAATTFYSDKRAVDHAGVVRLLQEMACRRWRRHQRVETPA
jgi:sulfatase maturation enzyme AslB (radical SAM superfamily)